MLIAGIDPGLAHLGWARMESRDRSLRGSGHIATHKDYEVGDTQRRIDEVIDALVPVIRGVDLVVVEWSPVSTGGGERGHGNPRSAALNACIATAAIAMARVAGAQVLSPSSSTWRARLGYPPGNEAALHAALARHYPATAASFNRGQLPHVLDGLGLALFGVLHATNLITTTATTTDRRHDRC